MVIWESQPEGNQSHGWDSFMTSNEFLPRHHHQRWIFRRGQKLSPGWYLKAFIWQLGSDGISSQMSRCFSTPTIGEVSTLHHHKCAQLSRFLSPRQFQSLASANEWTWGAVAELLCIFRAVRLWSMWPVPFRGAMWGYFWPMGCLESGPTQNRWQTQAMRKEGCFPMGRKPGLIMEGRETKRKGRWLCVRVRVCPSRQYAYFKGVCFCQFRI